MKNQKLRDALNSHNRPMVSLGEIAAAMGMEYQSLWLRLRNLPSEEKPPTMQAGGQKMCITSSAIAWAEKHLEKFPRKTVL